MELEEFKQKFNLPRINDYLNRIGQKEEEWFWKALWEIKKTFPTLDIYHAGSGKYGYIGVGIKPDFETRVSSFILSSEMYKHRDDNKNLKFVIGVVQTFADLIELKGEKIEYWFTSQDIESRNFKGWLEQVKEYALKHNYSLKGQGLLPTDYIKQNFTAQHAIEFLKYRYPNTYSGTTHIAAFRTNSHRQLALDPKAQSVSIFCDAQPPENTGLYVKTYYEAGKTRNHHLSTHAPDLDKGFEAYLVSIDTLEDLEKFCDWYESDSNGTLVNHNFNEDKEMQKNKFNQPLNRILFGAAGTGKTYHTVNHALSILEKKTLKEIEAEEQQPNGRQNLKDRFDKLKKAGCIVFVTFHQSFSYEDFVEGIRAETDDQGNLTYNVKSGVFKDICEKATGVSQQAESIDEIVEKFLDEITEIPLELYTQQNKKFKVSYVGSGVTLQCQPLASETNATYYANIGKIKSLLSGEQIENAYNRSYIKAVAEFLRPKVKPVQINETNQKHVLIIDEINRGNISRIFGELITLIEDSKRADADEQLSVILPYSKKDFTVPSNLYIIGTMNSSDRSLTGLDIALRRRFTFIEMPPRPELLKDISIEGVDIEKLLTVINQRIEVLLDRDHSIGHANFMSLNSQSTVDDLAQIFKQKIIPQLQEYFFDDWAKINLVLNGNGMLKSKSIEKSTIFPNVDSEDLGYFEHKKAWELVQTSFNDIEPYRVCRRLFYLS